MAKSKLRQQKERIRKRINATISGIDRLQKSTASIAQAGCNKAKEVLAAAIYSPDFTQKHEQLLVNEIGVSEFSATGYKVYAPITQGDNNLAYEMYFAEYGAGLGASMAKSTPKGVTELVYIPTTEHYDGYWFYPFFPKDVPKEIIKKNGEPALSTHGFTNTSIAVNYMWSARQEMKRLLNQEIENCQKKTKIKFKRLSPYTSITRPKG